MGGLAANLARVGSFVAFPKGKIAVDSLLRESKYFIEWTAAEFVPETAAQLVDIQRKLIRWQKQIDLSWDDGTTRIDIGIEAKGLSDILLSKSGLLDTP